MHRPGIDPRPPAWQASILPLNHRCFKILPYLDTLALMNEAYKDEKLSRTQVYFWYKRFKDGRKSIAEDSRFVHYVLRVALILKLQTTSLTALPSNCELYSALSNTIKNLKKQNLDTLTWLSGYVKESRRSPLMNYAI
ncbi:GVQW3 [Cordylochernes scorpioides]|uniref:GVQW3 n=1 Tax=Cordylochernes scorpioides TaxID=51811 RepID=A0ABY6KVC9_9ARAC|nr:GVQW3 [Cordylochernes scorpioides]